MEPEKDKGLAEANPLYFGALEVMNPQALADAQGDLRVKPAAVYGFHQNELMGAELHIQS